MREVGKEDNDFVRRKAVSAMVMWLLVTSMLLIVIPLNSPGSDALLYHSGGSASWEDQDFGGGLDYNGDPAGDKKVTWHAANNSHIMDKSFVVNDGYILEIEAGVDLKLNTSVVLQIGSATGASFYCNGTPGSFVTISWNISSSPWQGIYFVGGSYSHIEYTTIYGGGTLWVDDSTLDLSMSGISIMNLWGIYASSSTITVSGCVFMFTANSGIYSSRSTLSLTASFFSDIMSPAVWCDSTNATIDNCNVYGWNASAGFNGGHAIYLNGTSSMITISNSTVMGGSGGDGGGNAGSGIFDINYDGRVRILDNDLIQGGRGGDNMLNGGTAGPGGYAIQVSPVADYSSPPAIEIVNNPLVLGGDGGYNLATMGGTAGDGGHAIRIADDTSKGGEIQITNNNNVIGGNGGRNDASWGAGGWQVGSGGDGIRIESCQSPGSVSLSLNPNIMGGRGGNTTNSGTPGTLPQAGDGGDGIIIYQTHGVSIDQSVFTGGDGGDNTPGATSTRPGDGGTGVILYSDTPPGSGAYISSSTINGGSGGINFAPSQVSARGGNGLFSGGFWGSSGSAVNCDITGGEGGANGGGGGIGGDGGYGSSFSNSINWLISGGSMTGGKGGDNFDIRGGGGSGNASVLMASANDDITISGLVTVVGGAGGDSDTGDLGPGSGAQTSMYLGNSNNLNIIGSNITVAPGGFNATSGSYGQNGSFCIYGIGLGGSNTVSGNDITTNENIAGKNGIYLDSSSMTLSDNDIYNCYMGLNLVNCNGISVGSMNNLYDNFIGVYLSSSDPSSIYGNTITGNGYGIYCINSNPTITGDTVLDSTTTGVFLDSGSAPTFEDVTIEDSTGYNVYCNNGAAPKFYNCTLIQTTGTGEFFMIGDSHPWLLNTTFDKSALGFGDMASNITVNWYMHVRVVDTGYTPVSGATVWVNDTFGVNLETGVTDGQGRSDFIVVNEYIENWSGYITYFSPHNVDAWEGGRYGVSQPMMSETRIVIVMLGGAGFDIHLKQGWNMISIPVNQSSTLLADVLAPISGLYNAVQWYDTGSPLDHWKHYHVSKGALNDMSEIDRTMGIWLHMKTEAVFPVLGPVPVPSHTDIQLRKGWNFVGYPSFTKRVAGNETGEAFEGIGTYLDIVQYFDASDAGNPWKEWDYGTYSPDDLISVKPGQGLWIHVNADCTWGVGW